MQTGRWSESELQLIRDVFKDEEFVLAIRDVMMGFSDKFEHKTSEAVLLVLEKSLLPEFEPNIPLGMQQDLCLLSLDFLPGFNAQEGMLRIEAFDIAKDYLERRYDVLLGTEDTGENLAELKSKEKATKEERFVRMLAYLQLGNYIEKNLSQLVAIANSKEMTPEELKKQKEMNSNR